MKTWTNAEVEEVVLSETQYGGKTVNSYDNLWTNEDHVWEGTFVRS